jgi:hypothetical protein
MRRAERRSMGRGGRSQLRQEEPVGAGGAWDGERGARRGRAETTARAPTTSAVAVLCAGRARSLSRVALLTARVKKNEWTGSYFALAGFWPGDGAWMVDGWPRGNPCLALSKALDLGPGLGGHGWLDQGRAQ